MRNTVIFTLNGRPVVLEADDERMLLWVLRTDLALTGTKYGCGEGICGACAVIVNGRVLKANPKTQIVVECLKAEHRKLGPEVSEALLQWASETKRAGLDVSSFGLVDLSALAKDAALRGRHDGSR